MTTLVEARTRAAVAATILVEVETLEPELRDSLTGILDEAIHGFEELLERLLKTFESGISLSDAAIVARVLAHSTISLSSSVELVAANNPELGQWKAKRIARLDQIKEHARAMLRLAELPPPVLDPERMRQAQEQMERGEGFDKDEILARLRAE